MPGISREERAERMQQILSEEAQEPPGWWYLSFADERGFLGAAVVRAPGFLSAVMLCHALEINPGGEARGWPVPEQYVSRFPKKKRYRLLKREEIPDAVDLSEWDAANLSGWEETA